MTSGASIVSRAFEVFRTDAAAPPPLTLRGANALFRDPVPPRSIVVPGSPRAERLDGLTHGDSPAEPQTLAMVFAIARDELITLSIRSWPRDDLDREVERILESFEVAPTYQSETPA